MELLIQETIEALLTKLCTPFKRVRIEAQEDNNFRVNIESEEPSLLIGHHGDNIYALQNILRNIMWKQRPDEQFNITLDVDDYRKRQEDNVINLAERKVESLKKTAQTQSLPPMSPYFRRLVHLHLADKYEDIVTQSVGEGDFRYLTIKPKVSGE